MSDSNQLLISEEEVLLLKSFEDNMSSMVNAVFALELGVYMIKQLLKISAEDCKGRG